MEFENLHESKIGLNSLRSDAKCNNKETESRIQMEDSGRSIVQETAPKILMATSDGQFKWSVSLK